MSAPHLVPTPPPQEHPLPHLADVDAALSLELGGPRGGLLCEAERHLCLSGGKRLRPTLLLLFGEVTSAPFDALRDAAVAVELVHSASLLHDDVVDEGRLRRGLPTANARFGNSVAVLAGDHLLARALVLLSRHPRGLSQRAAEVVGEMARAAVLEVEARRDPHLGLSRWTAIAQGKTAALFGLCGYAAGVLASEERRGARFEEALRALGVAFQLQDDLADLVDVRQDRCGDLREGNPSHPVLAACAADPQLAAELAQAWRGELTAAEACAFGDRVLATRAVEETLAAIRAEVAVARAALLPEAAHPALAPLHAFIATLLKDPREELK